jgi:hypothetical protein
VGALEQILGASGIGVVIIGVVWLLTANRLDRGAAVDEIQAANDRADAAQKREEDVRAAAQQREAALRAELDAARAALQATIDAERDRRRTAEDRRNKEADAFAEQSREWRGQVDRLTSEIEQMRKTVT